MNFRFIEKNSNQNLMPTVAINLVLVETRILSGDSIQAQVVIDSADPDTIVNELYAEVKGIGRSGWVNIHTDKIYETEKEYMNTAIQLCRAPMPLRAGRHQFSFHATVPENAPSSFESQFGTIRYTIKITMVSNSQQATIAEVFPFLVVTKSYFDDIPSAIMRQIEYKDEVDFTVCSLPFGTVYLKVIMPRTGYRLGESIPVKVCVKNSTRKALKDCKMQLVLKTQFEAMSRYEHVNEKKLMEHIIDSFTLGRVKGKTDIEFDICHLKVPENAVPSQHSSRNEIEPNIIILSYVLRLSATPGIETEIPLLITSNGYRNTIKHGSVEEVTAAMNEIKPPIKGKPRLSIVEGNMNSRRVSYYC